ncbi:MAG: NUDIX hydrolase, partial [Burkholderiales bacterium]|nr:NUDIX hydrolase [Burkholderiales bacterium]
MDKHLKETPVATSTVYQGHFLRVDKDTVQLPDGKHTAREFIRHPGAVVVLPILDDGQILMERQYRYPLHQTFIEFPAGKIDAGEDHLVCA